MKINKESWLEFHQAKGLSDQTIKTYIFYLKKFDWGKLNQEYINKFLNRYKDYPSSKAMVNNTFEYIKAHDYPDEIKDKIDNITLPKVTGRKKKKVIQIISREDIHSIGVQLKNPRDKIMLFLSYYCALRAGELLQIRPFDFSWNTWKKNKKIRGKLKILGKGNQERFVYVIPDLMERIYKWIKGSISETQDKEDYLFKIKLRRWERILEKASLKSINKRVNPHLLRHSCATYLIEQGLDVSIVKEFLGHKRISTTERYLHISKTVVAEKIEEAFS